MCCLNRLIKLHQVGTIVTSTCIKPVDTITIKRDPPMNRKRFQTGTNMGLLKISFRIFRLGYFLRSVSVHFGSPSQNLLKLILKSPRFVPFGTNRTFFKCQTARVILSMIVSALTTALFNFSVCQSTFCGKNPHQFFIVQRSENGATSRN